LGRSPRLCKVHYLRKPDIGVDRSEGQVGAAGTFALGVALFGDALNAIRMTSILLIIAGVVGLKIA